MSGCFPTNSLLAERDKAARARVVAEKEHSLNRVRQARERWETEEPDSQKRSTTAGGAGGAAAGGVGD